MLSQFRIALEKAAENLPQYLHEYGSVISSPQLNSALFDAGVKFIDYEYDGGFYNRIYKIVDFGINTPELNKLTFSDVDLLTTAEAEAVMLHLLQNRMKFVALCALEAHMAGSSLMVSPFSVSNRSKLFFIDTTRYVDSEWNVEFMQRELRRLASNTVFNKDMMRVGVVRYNDWIERLQRKLQREETKKSTIVDFFAKRPDPDTASKIMAVKDEFTAAYKAMPSNGLTARTWGFEVEIADCKGVEPPFGIEKGEDGSLRSYEASDDCDCDCDDCTYHECNCDWCENNNTDPDHCGSSYCTNAEPAEFKSKNGISRLQHAGLFKLCKELDEVYAEVNDTCGVHIHVYAQDLDSKQVAQVLASYKWVENIMSAVAGRSDVNYAKAIPMKYVQSALKGNGIPQDKPVAVNLTHVINGERGTIEFRQLAGTYDAERITMWAWTVRGFVECAKRGMKFNDFINVTTFNGIIEVFAKYNYFLHDEGPQRLIPGGMRDNHYIKRQSHRIMERS